MDAEAVAGVLLLLCAGLTAAVLTTGSDRRFFRWIGVSTIAGAVVLSGPVAFNRYLATAHVAQTPRHVALTSATASSNGQIAAAVYIRDHSGVNDLVMTNRHCIRPQVPDHCDSRRWLVTAFTERQVLIEGWTATNTPTRLAPQGRQSVTINYWHPALLVLNDDFYTHPTAAAERKLWAMGVRWAYEENTRPHASTLAPYAILRYHNADASAWQLTKP